jgi:hypothetical protein
MGRGYDEHEGFAMHCDNIEGRVPSNRQTKKSNVERSGLQHLDDPFDSLLGSTALRGETNTTIALYKEDRQPVIATETRIGRNIHPTILNAELVESAGADVVKGFLLGKPFAEWESEKAEKTERKRKTTHEERIIAYLQSCDGNTASREQTLNEVEGKRTLKIAAIEVLKESGVVIVTGIEHSPTNPLALHLNQETLPIHNFVQQFGGEIQQMP